MLFYWFYLFNQLPTAMPMHSTKQSRKTIAITPLPRSALNVADTQLLLRKFRLRKGKPKARSQKTPLPVMRPFEDEQEITRNPLSPTPYPSQPVQN